MKAYRVFCEKYYPGSVAHYANDTAGKARYNAWQTILENHYKVKFGDIKVVRVPEYDSFAEKMIRPGNIDHLLLQSA